jgi:adenylylsulfate kinase-like enzyme
MSTTGTGKSTFAEILISAIRKHREVLHLDGDALREAFADPNYVYDRASRKAGGFRYARLASLVSKQGLPVVVSTISLFHELHQWNRDNFENYVEIYLECSEETLRSRDSKGLYQKEDSSKMPGINQEFEAPLQPDHHLFEPSIESLKLLAIQLAKRTHPQQ